MKRLLAIAMLAMLALTSCATKDTADDVGEILQNDPIYSEDAHFNSLHNPTESLSSDLPSDSGEVATEPTVRDAFSKFASAFASAKKLGSYTMTASGAVGIEIEGTSVELEKSTETVSLDVNGDYSVSRRIDLKDAHNTSVSQTVEEIYGSKSAGKNYLKAEFFDFSDSNNDFLEIKRTSYKRPQLANALGAAQNVKSGNVDTVTVTEADGAATVKLMLGAKFAAEAARSELAAADITAKLGDITVSYYIITAVIDAEGVLAAGGVSARVSVKGADGESVYTVSREFAVSDKNSDSVLCIKPEWV